MYKWLDLLLLLLLLCFVHQKETTPRSMTRKKGGSVTLSCESEAKEISDIVLTTLSKNIPVCEKEECKSENSRVIKEGSCDVVIKDLRFSDAGKYFLRVYYTNDQTELERQTTEYHLHIHDEISVQKGEDLKLDVLLINADKVERNSSEGWTEVWTRGHGVNSDRLTVSDETLIINEFTVTDTGTYRVLDSNNDILITVSVTESGTESKTDDHKVDEIEQQNSRTLTGALLVIVVPLVLLLILFAVIMLYQCLRPEHRL